MALQEYRRKRDFKKTAEPEGGKASKTGPIFVVQKHWASHLHYDFRLEAFGVLKSWAVPKGPPLKPGEKRLAVEVEDHPMDYADFEGTIPAGEYGAGRVKIWDHGTWHPPQHLRKELERGHLEFELTGDRLHGKWLLQRTRGGESSKPQWLLIKRTDASPAPPKKAKDIEASRLPDFILPQLAQLRDEIPIGPKWAYELKFDGYRSLAYVENGHAKIYTRSGLDWTKKYRSIAEAVQKLPIENAIFDGEIVAAGKMTDQAFGNLQKALKDGKDGDLAYYLFDLLFLNGHDLRGESLENRKALLKKLLGKKPKPPLLFSEHWEKQGHALQRLTCHHGLEGVVCKDLTAPYKSGRGESWQKVKCSRRQEFVIGGYTDPGGSRNGLGALLMGIYEAKKLRYVGKVGTGFSGELLHELREKLSKLDQSKSPFKVASPRGRGIHWIKPILVAEVEFKTWTPDGMIRQASFQGLRGDKNARDVQGEGRTAERPQEEDHVKLTHPDRIIFPKEKITKAEVAKYYKNVSKWLLPHLADRPLALLRCPDSASKTCFVQKHLDKVRIVGIETARVDAEDRTESVIFTYTEAGLLGLVQWGAVELHGWQCHIETAAHPDLIVFDLDPDEAVKWPDVRRTAFEIRDLLSTLKLKSFVKTTGGKGLHIHVPIRPIYSWDAVKEFSKTLMLKLESENPELYTTKMAKTGRSGKIFLDYLRNGFGSLAVLPYSLRAREIATVAVPITWNELKSVQSAQAFTLGKTLTRLAKQKRDPWPLYFKLAQAIPLLDQAASAETTAKKRTRRR